MAAEETRWTVGDKGATMALTTTTKKDNQQISGGRGGGRRQLARGGAQWWRGKSDCCTAAEEKQRHGGGSRGRRQVGRHGAGCSLFFWMNPTSILPSTILSKKEGNFFDFLGEGLARFEVGLGLASFFGVFWSSYLQS